jgi:uncharacterized protein with von Willebrand factor type A (vWA) domain
VPAYSPEALLRRKSFEECTPDDLAAMERLLAASRRASPRGRAGGSSPRADAAATIRAGAFAGRSPRAASSWSSRGGRAPSRTRLVVLCDTSGSMDAHTRFLLTFLLALKKAARRTEVFAFNTALTRLTP